MLSKDKQLAKPAWLRRKLPQGPGFQQLKSLIGRDTLHTVCQEARCPNSWECFSNRTAAFLLMGSICTRNCGFCNITTGCPKPLNPLEPENVAKAAASIGLDHVVLTSVSRDDLKDGGASVFAETIIALQETISKVVVEVLVPDFRGSLKDLETVVRARPDIVNHNIETVERLYPSVRPQASYERSLEVFNVLKEIAPQIRRKSGIMLGLGEIEEEVSTTINDLLLSGCELLTMGQYLQPSQKHLPVQKYITPAEFDSWQERAKNQGFDQVLAGPLVRSSYHAKEMAEKR